MGSSLVLGRASYRKIRKTVAGAVNDAQVAREPTLVEIRDRIPKPTESGNLPIAIAEDPVGLAKDRTIRDPLPRMARLQIFDSRKSEWVDVADVVPAALKVDEVGVVRDDTVRRIQQDVSGSGDWRVKVRNDEYLANLNIPLSDHRDSIINELRNAQPRMARLQIYDSRQEKWVDVVDRLPISLDVDNVGLAKDSTMSRVQEDVTGSGDWRIKVRNDEKLENLDIPLSKHRDAVVQTLEKVLPRVARLQIYSSEKSEWVDVTDMLPVSLRQDSVGLAREETLKEIRDRLPSELTDRGNLRVAILEDRVGLLKTADIPKSEHGNLLTALAEDLVGLAKDRTLIDIRDRLPKELTEHGNFRIAIAEDLAGLAKDSTVAGIVPGLRPARSEAWKPLDGVVVEPRSYASFDIKVPDGWSHVTVVVRVKREVPPVEPERRVARIVWLYSPDGENYDSVDEAERRGNYYDIVIPLPNEKERQITLVIPAATPHIKVMVINANPEVKIRVDAWYLYTRV